MKYSGHGSPDARAGCETMEIFNRIQILRNHSACWQSYYVMRLLILLSVFLFPLVSLAGGSGPWCHVVNEDEKCTFRTAESCYASAASGGTCRENPRTVGVQGDSLWCVVSAEGRKCKFMTQRPCLQAAQRMNGGCVENTEKKLEYARRGGNWGAGEGDESSVADLAAELAEASEQ